MDDLEQRLSRVENLLATREKERDLIKERVKLRIQWNGSLLRYSVAPLSAYIVTALFYYSIDVPDPWLRAIAPVLSVVTFLFVFPLAQRHWRKRAQKKDGRNTTTLR